MLHTNLEYVVFIEKQKQQLLNETYNKNNSL